MTHVTCRLTAKNQDQVQNPTLGNRVWATFFTHYRASSVYCYCYAASDARGEQMQPIATNVA